MRLIILILTLVFIGLLGLLWFAKQLYTENSILRLDPLQLSVYPQSISPKVTEIKRAVFYGDSRALSWPVPTLKGWEFVNRGIGQQTSTQIRQRFSMHIQPLQADLIIVQMCVNDLKAIPLLPESKHQIIEQCKTNIREVIQAAKANGSKVLLTTVFPVGMVSPLRWLVWSDDVAAAINEVNVFIRQQQDAQVDILDAYHLLQGTSEQINPDYSRDLLHLNARGYEVLNTALVTYLNAQQ